MLPIELDISSSFFEEEIRCDYKVSTRLKKIWAVELDLLNKFILFCKTNDIKVIVWAGTLLGAIRHKGFIPWDDDADVAMTRSDYEKLAKIISEKNFDDHYFLQNAYNDRKFFFAYSRFRNSETTGHIIGNDSADYNNGIYIDVFVLDGYGTSNKEQKKHMKDRKFCEKLLWLGYSSNKSSSFIKKLIKSFLRCLIRLFYSYDNLLDKHKKVMMRYKDSKKIGLFTHSDFFVERYWCSSSAFNDIEEVDFEMIKVPVPKNYDSILKNMYGDYMRFPPVEKRGIWHEGIIYFDPDLPYKKYFSKGTNEK